MKTIASLLAALTLLLGGAASAAPIRSAGIDHVGINVPGLVQAEQFFGDAFGCTAVTHIGPFPIPPSMSHEHTGAVPAQADSVRIAMLRCGSGANIELFEYKNAQGAILAPEAGEIGASHIAFYTDDVAGGVANLKARGITILGEPVTMPGGETAGETWVHFLSPWGSEMELVGYPHGKGYEKSAKLKLWSPKYPAR
jgi:catechol 2,3-dioxygenase-like lactoylglutathione lyase family enzyme